MLPGITAAKHVALAYLRAVGMAVCWWVLLPVNAQWSLAETRQVLYPDRELVRAYGIASAVDGADFPLELLPPQSCGYSPLARPDELPLKGRLVPAFPCSTSGKLGLAIAAVQSHDPNVGLLLLSPIHAPVSSGQGLAELWLTGCGCMLLFPALGQYKCYTNLLGQDLEPYMSCDPFLHRLTEA